LSIFGDVEAKHDEMFLFSFPWPSNC